ncbi:hypothetical protein B0T20DRAFT_128873 [Sordaria brevicollis]|uniref:Uncharacterized protein n=1 Tax=Sordaria brevicollis TaxID=83679 RepID=A0AAE0UFB5_SORBR|nr:hypothetical protein B0T20DRAFT_128873 [Sordaria brevicollis]
MADQNNNTNNGNHHDELTPELQSAMELTSIFSGKTVVIGNSTSNNGAGHSHSPSHQHGDLPTPAPSVDEILEAFGDMDLIDFRHFEGQLEEDGTIQPYRMKVLAQFRRLHARYEELVDRVDKLFYAAGEPNPEGSQSAATTTTANDNSTSRYFEAYDEYTSMVSKLASIKPIPPEILSSGPDAVLPFCVSEGLPRTVRPYAALEKMQEQLNIPGYHYTILLDLISNIRSQLSRLRDSIRVLDQYIEEGMKEIVPKYSKGYLKLQLLYFREITSTTSSELDD